MPRLKVKVRYPKPKIKDLEDEIHKAMSEYVVDQLRVWVVAATNPIPVLTGAAKASFTELAERARVSLVINPSAPSRIPLGIAEADSIVVADRSSGEYGWSFSSTLEHLPIVDDRVGFISKADQALRQSALPVLPPIMTEPTQ